MAGIINWNELWKIMRASSPWRRTLDERESFWDKRAKQFNESMMQNRERAERQIAKIELAPEYTVLDVGAGTGRLAIPIAKRVTTVTAIDPSIGMLACLQENMEKEGVTNVISVNKRWEDIELGVDIMPHDVVIASGSLGMLDIQEALAKIDAAARRYVYLFTSAGKGMDKGVWKVIYGETPSTDYIYIYNILHGMEIYANVEISDSDYEQRYGSLDEAVTKMKEMYDLPSEKEGILREHLSKILVEDENDGTLCVKRKSKSAMIWWEKDVAKV